MSRPGLFRPPPAVNEPVRDYAPGSPERAELEGRIAELKAERLEIPCIIGGEEIRTGETFESVMPHDKDHVLGDVHKAGATEVDGAIASAAQAWEDWHRLPWEERAAVFLRAAELLAGPWRSTLVAATMLNQSKTSHQAEIDAACEVIDFWRFNVEFMLRIYAEQPVSSPGVWNRMEYRPLEGFVFAVSPFNFTAIGANLTASPALMGNTIIWKPASTAAFSAYWTMRLLEEAGLPPGVINLVYGSGAEIGDPVLASEHLAGVHFTGRPRSSTRSGRLSHIATQFVVHEAFEMMWCDSGSYSPSLTPSTIVTSGSVAGAEMTTFRAPPSRCFSAPSRLVKMPVDSITTSTPRSSQGRFAGSRSARSFSSLPPTVIVPSPEETSSSSVPSTESCLRRCAMVFASPRSFAATTSKSPPRFR